MEEKQAATETKQPAVNFGREVLARVKAGNTSLTEEQQSGPLVIDIRGVGNSQTEEEHTENTQTNKNGSEPIKIDDPYVEKTLESLKKRNQGSLQEANQNLKQENPQQSDTLNYLNQIGQNENTDNIAAQPDPDGKYPNALEPIRKDVNRATWEFVNKTADITRQQQETGEKTHLPNWAADVAKNTMQNPITHSQQDYQPKYQAILGHPAYQKLAEAAATTGSTTS